MSSEAAAFAKGLAYDLGSMTFGRLPLVADKLGTADSIEGNPTRWRLARGTFLNPRFGSWIRHAGIEDGGTRPIDYPDVAVMTFNKSAVEQACDHYPTAKHAGAYVLDQVAIMVGTSPSVEIFGADPTDESRHALGMRIGEGLFLGQPGLLAPRRRFIPLEAAELRTVFAPIVEVDPSIPII